MDTETPNPTNVEQPSAAPEAPKQSESKIKKFIPLMMVGAGLLVIAVVIALVAFATMGVSKKDYNEAVMQYNAVSRGNTLLGTQMTSLGLVTNGTDETFDNTANKVDATIESIKVDNEALGKLKAVRKGDGVELYKTFDDKLKTYLQYGSDLVVSIKIARPAILTCDNSAKITEQNARIAALKECSSQLGALKPMPNPEFDGYAKTLQKSYATYATDYEAITKLTDPYGAQYEQYKKLRDEVYAVQADVTKANRDYRAAIKKHDDEVSVKSAANALSQYLEKNQR